MVGQGLLSMIDLEKSLKSSGNRACFSMNLVCDFGSFEVVQFGKSCKALNQTDDILQHSPLINIWDRN